MILKNWYLNRCKHPNKECMSAYASGILASEHPKLCIGEFITTSFFEKLTLNKEKTGLDAITHSGSHYELLFENNDVDLKNLKEILDNFNIENNEEFFEKIKEHKKEKEKKLLNESNNILNNNELLLIMAGDSCVDAYMKFENEIKKVRTHTHVGMFQDSVLISNNKVDFRYFPMGDSIEIYHWSDGLENVLIKNIGNTDIEVLDRNIIKCKANKITKISGKAPHNEGLFSPDFVNGKSILTRK